MRIHSRDEIQVFEADGHYLKIVKYIIRNSPLSDCDVITSLYASSKLEISRDQPILNLKGRMLCVTVARIRDNMLNAPVRYLLSCVSDWEHLSARCF